MIMTMEKLVKDGKTFRRVPKGCDHKCFGCSPANPHGLQMEFYHADDAVLHSWLVVPEHLCGWNDLVHGGVISTILDEIMSWTAIYMLKKFILTKTMTVEFLKPLRMGTRLSVRGNVAEMVSEREAVIEGFLYDEREDKLFARSSGVYALLDMKIARRMGVVDDEAAKRFEPIFGK